MRRENVTAESLNNWETDSFLFQRLLGTALCDVYTMFSLAMFVCIKMPRSEITEHKTDDMHKMPRVYGSRSCQRL